MSTTNIKTSIRYLLGDNSTSGSDIFTYGSSNIFTLTEANVISISSVLKNDVEMGTSEVSFDTSTNKATINLTMTSGDTIEIQYTYYPNYSDTELLNYILASLIHLSINNYKLFAYNSSDDTIYPELELKEENLISIIAATLIDPNNKSISLPDIRISLGFSAMSTEHKIASLIASYKKDSHGVMGIL